MSSAQCRRVTLTLSPKMRQLRIIRTCCTRILIASLYYIFDSAYEINVKRTMTKYITALMFRTWICLAYISNFACGFTSLICLAALINRSSCVANGMSNVSYQEMPSYLVTTWYSMVGCCEIIDITYSTSTQQPDLRAQRFTPLRTLYTYFWRYTSDRNHCLRHSTYSQLIGWPGLCQIVQLGTSSADPNL